MIRTDDDIKHGFIIDRSSSCKGPNLNYRVLDTHYLELITCQRVPGPT